METLTLWGTILGELEWCLSNVTPAAEATPGYIINEILVFSGTFVYRWDFTVKSYKVNRWVLPVSLVPESDY